MINYKVRKYRNGPLVKVGTSVLSELTIQEKLGAVPTATLTIPITEWSFFDTRVEVTIDTGDYTFCGLVESVTVNKVNETVDIALNHILAEWEFDAIPINVAVKQTPISTLYSVLDFARDLWTVDIQDDYPIEYTYSRQNKLEALTSTIENTKDIFWRVKPCGCRELEIGKFGNDSGFIISTGNPSNTSLAIIEEPTIEIDFSKIVNRAVITSGSVGNGMGQMTLREVYDSPALYDSQFPISITGSNINTDVTYSPLDGIHRSPNNLYEYWVTDLSSVAREGGQIYEATFTENDLYPFSNPDQPIENQDKIDMGVRVYNRAMRKLIRSRRRQAYKMLTTPLPCSVGVGDKIRFRYSNKLIKSNKCGYNSKDEVLKVDGEFYISELTRKWDKNQVQTNEIFIDEYLREDRSIKEY